MMKITAEHTRIQVEFDGTHIAVPFGYFNKQVPVQSIPPAQPSNRKKAFKLAGIITLILSLLGVSSGSSYYFAIKTVKKLAQVQKQPKQTFEVVIEKKQRRFEIVIVPQQPVIEEVLPLPRVVKASLTRKRFRRKKYRKIARRKKIRRQRKLRKKRVRCACK